MFVFIKEGRMKRFAGLLALVLMAFFTNTGISAGAPIADLSIENSGFLEKFKFYVEIYVVQRTGSDPFSLGNATLRFTYNGTVLSSPLLEEANPTFSTGNYAMNVTSPGAGSAELNITSAGVAGSPITTSKVRLARISFVIDPDPSIYRLETSPFVFVTLFSSMTTFEGVSVTRFYTNLSAQAMICRPTIGGTDDINIPVGQPYSFTPVAVACANAGPLTFAVSPDPLPEWLSFDAATGGLSGTPTFADRDTTTITITATDTAGDSAPLVYDLTVGCPAEALSISNTPVASANVGTAYQFDVDVAGGCGVVTYSMSANAPAWLQLDPTTGMLSGTPASGDVGTTEGIQITATDENNGFDGVEFDLSVYRQSNDGGGGGGCFISTLLP